jgi:hypothetical protein
VKSQHQATAVFDPETIDVMLGVIEDIADQREVDEAARSRLARTILDAVWQGERDPARLRECALRSIAN